MKIYKVADEFITAWYGHEMSSAEIESAQESGITIDEIERLAREWDVEIETLMEQLEEI